MASIITLSISQLLSEFIDNCNANFSAVNSELGSHTHAWDSITGKPTTFAPSSHQHAAGDVISGVLTTSRLGTGTPSNTNFLRGDGAWTALPWSDVSGGINYSSGNVGIGTTSPGYKLDVNGTFHASDVSTFGGNVIFGTDNAYDIGASGANRPRNVYVAGLGVFGGAITATQFNGSGAGLTSGTVPIAALVAGDYSAKITSGSYGISVTGSAASFTGALSGDVTGTQGATTVSKVNGAAVPASAAALGTNSSGQLIAVTGSSLAASYTDQGSSFTATSNTRYRLTANSIAVALPASPSNGDVVSVFGRVTGCSITRGGKSIAGASEDLTIDLNPFEVSLVYVSATGSWEIYE